MDINSKLMAVQKALKAPKTQFSKFGNYYYRSCEDILEAAKPLCIDNGLLLTLSDAIEDYAGRVYITATAKIVFGDQTIFVTASAREAENKKGFDEAQITGGASSYARKYALNGLFCIDDAKDADATKDMDHSSNPPKKQPPRKTSTPPTQSGKQVDSDYASVFLECSNESEVIAKFKQIWDGGVSHDEQPVLIDAKNKRIKEVKNG